jgi:magnesium-transporting ATPase (P-type)
MAKKVHDLGYMYKRGDQLELKYPNEIKKYKIIKVFDFTAHRKCMTVIVKSPDSAELFAFSKGADSAMMEMTKDKDGLTTNDVFVVKKFERDLKKFQTQGLRTLVYGYRKLPIEEEEVTSGRI